MESKFRVTVARPKSVICARPAASMRIFGWTGVGRQWGSETGLRTTTYSFEIAMNDVGGVEVVKAICDIR